MNSYCFLWTLSLFFMVSSSNGLRISTSGSSNSPIQSTGRTQAHTTEKTFKIPLGPFVIGIDTNKDFYEVSLLKKEDGGRGDRKHMQFFLPAFMVASQVGWYLLAFKLVSVLAIKALMMAKIAFIAAAIVTIKRVIMDPMQTGPAITPYLDHIDPYMVPYDFSTLGHGDLHPLSLAHVGHSGQSGSLAAESSVNSVTDTVSNLNSASSNLAQNVAMQPSNVAVAPKTIKRSDYSFTGVRPLTINERLRKQLNPIV